MEIHQIIEWISENYLNKVQSALETNVQLRQKLQELQNGQQRREIVVNNPTEVYMHFPLHMASFLGYGEMVKLLIEHKLPVNSKASANLREVVNSQNTIGYFNCNKTYPTQTYGHAEETPLLTAIRCGQLDVVKILMENGADVNCKGSWFEEHLAPFKGNVADYIKKYCPGWLKEDFTKDIGTKKFIEYMSKMSDPCFVFFKPQLEMEISKAEQVQNAIDNEIDSWNEIKSELQEQIQNLQLKMKNKMLKHDEAIAQLKRDANYRLPIHVSLMFKEINSNKCADQEENAKLAEAAIENENDDPDLCCINCRRIPKEKVFGCPECMSVICHLCSDVLETCANCQTDLGKEKLIQNKPLEKAIKAINKRK